MAKPPIGQRQLRVGRRSYNGCFYLITSATKHRAPIFVNDKVAHAAIEGFSAPKLLKDSLLFSWVLMPDHAHWLVQLGNYDSISTLVGKMKSASVVVKYFRTVDRVVFPFVRELSRDYSDADVVYCSK